jgi:ornithine cyclodeaminase/alanine dehydrogenase
VIDLAISWMADGMTAFDRIIVDDLEQEAAMPKPMVAPELVAGDLTGLVNGDIAGRCANDERTAFVSRGIGLGDLALAALAYQRACRASVGVALEE